MIKLRVRPDEYTGFNCAISSRNRVRSAGSGRFAGICVKSLYALSAILMSGYAAVFTLLAEMRTNFGFSETAIGAIAGSAFVAGFLAQLLLSRRADLGQGGLMLRLGLGVSVLGALWMCFAESLASWLAARMLLGFGAGAIRPAMRRLAFVIEPGRAGEMLGRLAAWDMVGFLIGPVMASLLFELGGLRLPFMVLTGLLVSVFPFVARVAIPGSAEPMKNPMRTLIRRPQMQACLALGAAFYLAVGVFDAIWALFVTDLGAGAMYIGITMSLFTLPMILIAPLAGRWVARRDVLGVLVLTLGTASLMMVSYGFIGSLYWILIPLLVHSVVDAVSMPASQLAVGYASGESAIAAGQGLFGATGLIVAALASVAGGFVYQNWGAMVVWLAVSALMGSCLLFALFRGRGKLWHDQTAVFAERH